MGLRHRAVIASRLVARGWDADTPAAIVTSAGRPEQARWRGTLEALAAGAPDIGRDAPGVIVIGDVVALADVLEPDAQGLRDRVEESAWQR
jgi:siroheme synthase